MSIDDPDDATRLDTEQIADLWWLEADERVALRIVQRVILDHDWSDLVVDAA